MRQLASTLATFLNAAAASVPAFLGWLCNEPVGIYRPEAHYMRGPGPASRAKHR